MPNFEDDMDRPVTKRELHATLNEALTNKLEPYATKQDLRDAMEHAMDDMREYVKQQFQLFVDAMIGHMTKLLRDQEDRIAKSVWSGLEMRVGAAIGALEDNHGPRIKRLEDKVFPPKRQRRR